MVLEDQAGILVQGQNEGMNTVTMERGSGLRVAAKIALFLCIIVFLIYGSRQVVNFFAFQMWPRHVDMIVYLLFSSATAYVVLMAVPFMPGIEMGIMIMMMFGRPGILLVYLCTLLALSLSFLVGRHLPPSILARALGWFHLGRARDLVLDLAPLGPEERLHLLLRSAPARVVPFLLRRRYLFIAFLLNLPGHAFIGGSGGIGMVVGMSKLFPFPKYLLMVSIAILPGPIFFLVRDVLR
jgi:hypothetical protein